MLKVIKQSALAISRSFGYDIMPLREVKERDFAIHLGQLFRTLDIDCVLDVGANTGQYRDFLRERALFQGRVVSFEPVTHNARILLDRAANDSRWSIESYALGSKHGPASLNVSMESQFSSFLEPASSTRATSFAGLMEAGHTENVIVETLDDVFPSLQQRLGFRNPYLKIDTQGYDLEVLRGAARSLRQIKALQIEASIIPIYKGMPNYVESIEFLNRLGFSITGLYPISRDEKLRLIEFDCVMINEEKATDETDRKTLEPSAALAERY